MNLKVLQIAVNIIDNYILYFSCQFQVIIDLKLLCHGDPLSYNVLGVGFQKMDQ